MLTTHSICKKAMSRIFLYFFERFPVFSILFLKVYFNIFKSFWLNNFSLDFVGKIFCTFRPKIQNFQPFWLKNPSRFSNMWSPWLINLRSIGRQFETFHPFTKMGRQLDDSSTKNCFVQTFMVVLVVFCSRVHPLVVDWWINYKLVGAGGRYGI